MTEQAIETPVEIPVEISTETPSTLLGGDPVVTPDAPQTWPESWRNDLAGGDEKELKQLERYASPQDIWKKARNLEILASKQQPRIEYQPDMPEDKLAKYREQEGIPASPKDYKLEFESGLVVGEADMPFVESFLESVHAKNMPESHAKAAVEWYLDSQIKQQEEMDQKNADVKHETAALLKAEFGSEFDGNMNALGELFVDHPEVRDVLMAARDDDGLQIGNNEEVLRWAIDVAKKVNPAATVVLPGGESGIKGLESRITEIETMMRENREAYDRDPNIGKEYEDLLDKRERINNR